MCQLNQDTDYTCCVPEQSDHIVTSNSIDLMDFAKVSSSILHVDPDPEIFENRKRLVNKVNFIKAAAIEPMSRYSKMRILSKSDETTVINPPFGSNYHLVAYKERKLGGFTEDIDIKIKALNKRIRAKQMHTLLISNDSSLRKFLSIEKNSIEAYSAAVVLLSTLSKKCKPNFLEYLFKTKNYYLKREVKAILDDAKITLQKGFELPQEWSSELAFN
ncbi:hypothetical protein ACQUW5_02755 [Legionella sp. CNM-1927-20]|uniref:hypothetical protein n=1 Tax=Legionella sp. CNM-1927-20 TaxID=3422221 RepID=UPI00403AFAEB